MRKSAEVPFNPLKNRAEVTGTITPILRMGWRTSAAAPKSASRSTNMAKSKSNEPKAQKYSFGIPVSDRSIPDWHKTPGTYIAGSEVRDDVDLIASEMEAKWGADRLRLLVGAELREKFDRQRYKFNQAIWHGTLEEVRQEGGRMVKAWQVLDRAAVEAGMAQAAPEVWEVPLRDGRVAAIVRDWRDVPKAKEQQAGRHVLVYTLDEIANLIENLPQLAVVKEAFPGAQVTRVGPPSRDPLLAIPDSHAPIDDVIPF